MQKASKIKWALIVLIDKLNILIHAHILRIITSILFAIYTSCVINVIPKQDATTIVGIHIMLATLVYVLKCVKDLYPLISNTSVSTKNIFSKLWYNTIQILSLLVIFSLPTNDITQLIAYTPLICAVIIVLLICQKLIRYILEDYMYTSIIKDVDILSIETQNFDEITKELIHDDKQDLFKVVGIRDIITHTESNIITKVRDIDISFILPYQLSWYFVSIQSSKDQYVNALGAAIEFPLASLKEKDKNTTDSYVTQIEDKLNQETKEEIDKINQKDEKLSIQELVDKRIKEVVHDRPINTQSDTEIEYEETITNTLKDDLDNELLTDEVHKPENTTETNTSKNQSNKSKKKRKRRKKRKK